MGNSCSCQNSVFIMTPITEQDQIRGGLPVIDQHNISLPRTGRLFPRTEVRTGTARATGESVRSQLFLINKQVEQEAILCVPRLTYICAQRLPYLVSETTYFYSSQLLKNKTEKRFVGFMLYSKSCLRWEATVLLHVDI